MPETRDFPTAVIASLSSGVMLCKFSEMHEAAEFLMGHPIWTHQFADEQLCGDMRQAIARQCPGMPTRAEAEAAGIDENTWRAYAAKIEADIGPTVKLAKGSGLTAMLPTDGIPDHLKDKTIIVQR